MFLRTARILFFLLVPLGTFYGCSKSEPVTPEVTVTIESLHRSIVGVLHGDDDNKEVLEIIFNSTSVWNASSVTFALARDAKEVAQGLQQHFPDLSEKIVRFTVKVPLTDKYGNSEQTKVLSLNILTADLMKINHNSKAFLLQDMLNLSQNILYFNPIGYNLVTAFCKDEISRRAAQFCAREGY
jgi:Fe-S-cluster formation regulator IscX/YfhJ